MILCFLFFQALGDVSVICVCCHLHLLHSFLIGCGSVHSCNGLPPQPGPDPAAGAGEGHISDLGSGLVGASSFPDVMIGALTEAGLLHQLYLINSGNLTLGVISIEHWESSIVLPSPQEVVGWILIALFLLTRLLRELQGRVCWEVPYSTHCTPKRVTTTQAFRQKTRGLRVAGIIRRILLNLGEEMFALYQVHHFDKVIEFILYKCNMYINIDLIGLSVLMRTFIFVHLYQCIILLWCI